MPFTANESYPIEQSRTHPQKSDSMQVDQDGQIIRADSIQPNSSADNPHRPQSHEQSSQARKGSTNTRENNTDQSFAHQGTSSPHSLARIQNNAPLPTLNKINLQRDIRDKDMINQVLRDE